MVEHLTLNQGVQGSNPWRSTASTIFEDTGALGMVLFLRAMSHAINGKGTFRGACSPGNVPFLFIIRRMPQKRSSLPASFRHGSLLTTKHHLAFRLPAWLIAHNQAPPCLQASGMAHCPQACSIFPPGFRHGSLLTSMHHLSSSPPAVPQTLPAASA